MVTNTTEKAFQDDIIAHLVSTGYLSRGTKNYHKATGIDPELVLKFITETQEKEWKRWVKQYQDQAEKKFFFRLLNKIDKKGTIHILRNGFKDSSCTFKLFYPQPNNKKNPDLFDKYEHNIFSVIDELEYEKRDNGNRIDLVVFINGLPIVTIELKDTFSQGIEKAITQYKQDRDPRELIFQRTLVHFAMSDEKIYMATKLDGMKTRFLPFNLDIENPEPKHKNDYKTSYLYNDILQKNKLSKLIANYIYYDVNDEVTIFPRFHQLDCTNKLLNQAKPGENYLIQHSAGSGKTKTIAWLSHGLINKFNRLDNRVYDMVIVISDRKVIDRQLQYQIKQIEKVRGIVEKIDKNSKQLAEALKSGTNIIVTTIHKFPFVLGELGDLPKRKYAVIIDEAHSSQTGTMAKKMKRVLNINSLEEAEAFDAEGLDEVDEEILRDIEKSKNLKNVSFFAFTATPKNKTLEMFGTKDDKGKFYPFHLYSMKQAIEEGFILDVLKYYLSYESYFKLFKKVEDDPQYDEKKSKKLLVNFVEKHPHTIAKKTEIMLSHFVNSSMHKIKGKAKAMVVTRSRKHAVLYKNAIDKLIRERGYNFKALVAFTSKVIHDEKEYTENSLNNLKPNHKIEDAFNEDDYKLLIVANKFQTGFDQPLLHTMYVDKMLNGITAVQTLSRANRIASNKNDTLILDFANKPLVIQKAFQPYYETTYLKEATDPDKLYELEEKLLNFQIFEVKEVDHFVSSFMKSVSQTKLHAILHPIIVEFKKKKKKEQVEFKKTLRRYQNIYSFLSQLIPFSDVGLEKLYIFNKFLSKKLPTINNPLPYHILEDVDIDSYKLEEKGQQKIILTSDGELKPISETVSEFTQGMDEKLSKIIKDLNDAFGTEFSDDDKVFITRVKNNLLGNKELSNKIDNNSRQNVRAVFGKYYDKELSDLFKSDRELYKRLVDNDKLRGKLMDALFDLIYYEHKNKIESFKRNNI